MEEILLWVRVIGVLFLGTWALIETYRCGLLEDENGELRAELYELSKTNTEDE